MRNHFIIVPSVIAVLASVTIISAKNNTGPKSAQQVDQVQVVSQPETKISGTEATTADGDAGTSEGRLFTPPSPAKSPEAEEKIKWQVTSGGGRRSESSSGFVLTGSVVQTAVGQVASGDRVVNQGFCRVLTAASAMSEMPMA